MGVFLRARRWLHVRKLQDGARFVSTRCDFPVKVSDQPGHVADDAEPSIRHIPSPKVLEHNTALLILLFCTNLGGDGIYAFSPINK